MKRLQNLAIFRLHREMKLQKVKETLLAPKVAMRYSGELRRWDKKFPISHTDTLMILPQQIVHRSKVMFRISSRSLGSMRKLYSKEVSVKSRGQVNGRCTHLISK